MGGSPGGAATAGGTSGGSLPEGYSTAVISSRRAAVTTLLMNIASIVERADEGILPAVYFFIGRSLNASLSQLGTLTLARALVQALSSPLSGILGDRYDRTYVVALGCLLWGVMTAAIGLSQSLGQAMVSCAVNGFGLALVIPCVSSLVADYHPPDTRGNAFGMMSLTASLGGMAGAFYATNVGAMHPFGIEGWRFAFHLVAGISVITSYLVYRYAVDPRHPHHHPSLHAQHAYPATHAHTHGGQHKLSEGGPAGNPAGPTAAAPIPAASAAPGGGAGAGMGAGMRALDVESQRRQSGGQRAEQQGGAVAAGWDKRQVWRDVRSVLRIRSFQVIVLQGIVGSVPWQAMVWFTAWLQLLGFSDFKAAGLMATFSLGCALGGLLGGTLGDRMSRRLPGTPNGRILTNQISVLLGLPLSFLLVKGLPLGPDMGRHSGLYGTVFFLFGLSISWCGCNNSALMSELVPERQRSTIYAFDRSFEGAIGACGAPLVGLAAERLFGFSGVLGGRGSGTDMASRHANAAALGSALLVCMVVPWVFCLLSFTALHWTYKVDRWKPRRGDEDVVVEESRVLIDTAGLARKRESASARTLVG